MKIFISWSGIQAKEIAEALRDWLPDLLNVVKPFVSSQDIAKGERGLSVISEELEGSSFGIICVTRANQGAPWVNFEAGAISNRIGNSRVAPLLVDLPSSDLAGPLKEFQYTEVSDKADMFKMVESIWQACPDPQVEKDRLARNFDRLWPDLEQGVKAAMSRAKAKPGSRSQPPARTSDEKLDELLGLARQNHRRIDRLEEQVVLGGSIKKRPPSKVAESEEMRSRQKFAVQHINMLLDHSAAIRAFSVEPHPDGVIYISYSGSDTLSESLQEELSALAEALESPIIIQGPAGERAFMNFDRFVADQRASRPA